MSKEIDNNPSIVDMSFLTPMFDEAFNRGVDRCLLVVEKFNTGKELTPLISQIINQLTQLKKQIP